MHLLCLITYKVRSENGYGCLRPGLKTVVGNCIFLVLNWVWIWRCGRHIPTKNSKEYPPGLTDEWLVLISLVAPRTKVCLICNKGFKFCIPTQQCIWFLTIAKQTLYWMRWWFYLSIQTEKVKRLLGIKAKQLNLVKSVVSHARTAVSIRTVRNKILPRK